MSITVVPAGEAFEVQAYRDEGYRDAVATEPAEAGRLGSPAQGRRADPQHPLSVRASLSVWALFSVLGWALALVPAWLLIR